ncbi:SpoIIE family protein phosphatase [Leptospira sp. GIMC2001]|uniref:SpoIIE family protein phosphatase n=1 Tax=Leptospira sp. GIMC2001 TaxID=1513297 RepID=UPI00234AF28E|nr:SpoIIE family protein phosphatase [Leptospira sp. GIMC2001]WCL48544.1 SpoIIE family protein phosphatase [Leptospira sp. GIMC2001]
MSIEKSNPQHSLSWMNRPETSCRRASGLMLFYINERKIQEKNPFEEIMDDNTFLRMMKDSNLWIPQDLEERIINYLSAAEDISSALYQIGKESFLSQAYDLLPTDDSSIGIVELISRVPVLITKITRTVSLDILNLEDTSATFLFTYREPFKEKWYDVIFFKGMLDGLSLLYQLSGSKTILRETKLLGIHTHHKDLGDNIKFGANSNIYQMEWDANKTKIARTQINPEDNRKAQKTFVISRDIGNSEEELSVINLSSVISKSRELALENRDLEAAVEVLKSFKTELEIKQKSIAKDLKLAKNIQMGIIPQTIPDWKGVQFWNHFNPMQEVSGDYYDYFPFDENRLGVAICDVSGHGVPAAFITALSKMLFTTYRYPLPSTIFKNVNRDLLDLLKQQGYTTCIYAIIDKDYKVTYSVAGHPRPVLLRYRTGETSYLEGEGTFLGMFPEASDFYEDQHVFLEPGDKIFLYTDGLTEAENDDGEPFGDDKLLELVSQTRDMDIEAAVEFITAKHKDFIMGTDQKDDITIFGIGLSTEIPEFERLSKIAQEHYDRKQYNQASNSLKNAYKILPRESNNILFLAKTLAKEGKYHEAIDFLKIYNRFRLHNFESHNILGFCFFMIKEYEKAESELRKSLYMSDSHPYVHYNLARVYHKLGDREKFNSIKLKIRKLFPDFTRLNELNNLHPEEI